MSHTLHRLWECRTSGDLSNPSANSLACPNHPTIRHDPAPQIHPVRHCRWFLFPGRVVWRLLHSPNPRGQSSLASLSWSCSVSSASSSGSSPGLNEIILFWASFFTLIAAGIGFSVRGVSILTDWGNQFGFTQAELGTITGGGLIGFGLAIIFFSFFADRFGYGKLMLVAFLLHTSSAVVTFAATPVFNQYGKAGSVLLPEPGHVAFRPRQRDMRSRHQPAHGNALPQEQDALAEHPARRLARRLDPGCGHHARVRSDRYGDPLGVQARRVPDSGACLRPADVQPDVPPLRGESRRRTDDGHDEAGRDARVHTRYGVDRAGSGANSCPASSGRSSRWRTPKRKT